MNRLLRVAMVGVGQWGSNVLRALSRTANCEVAYLCDTDAAVLAGQAGRHTNARPVTDFMDVLADESVEAVVIATKAASHAKLASQALSAGKHVFVEKPLALATADAERLVRQADASDRRLMVGHLLIHHPAFHALERMLASGEIGRLYYAYAHRLNLGMVRRDENAWWSLAPHDVAVICRLFDGQPVSVAAIGQSYLQAGVEDVVFATLKFGDGRMGHIHVSWLDPHKIRKLTLVGTRRMVTWDDMSAAEKLRVYDKGAAPPDVASFAEAVALRSGDIVIPQIPGGEPLLAEMQHFIDCCLEGRTPLTDASDGLRVVRVLEAGQRSLEAGGTPVPLA